MATPPTPTPTAKIQCSTGPFWAMELEVAFDCLAEAGFTEVELMITRDRRTQEPEYPLELAEERGLHIASVHGPFLVITKGVWGLDSIGKITRGVEFCQAVGATSLVVHPPYLWENRYARWLRHEAPELEESSGVTIAVETMYPKWVAGRKFRGYRWLDPSDLVANCTHVALDTSHLTVGRYDVLDSYEILQSKLVHIHLSNNAGDGRDGHLELDKGILPLDRFLAELGRRNYAEVVSLELSVSRYVEQSKKLTEMLRRNREYLRSRLTAGRTRSAKGLPRA